MNHIHIRSLRYLKSLALMISLAVNCYSAETLTLERCIRLALEENFDLRVSRNAVERAEQDEIIANSQYLPEFLAGSFSSFSVETTSATDLDGSAAPQSDRDNWRTEVSQRLNTGGRITLSSAMNRNETNSSRNLLNPAYDSDVSLQIVQPLLSGFGSDVSKAQRRLSELEIELQKWSFRDQILSVINTTERSYHQVVFAQEQLKIRQSALDLATQLFEENKTKLDTGIATSLDVLQAEVGVANAKDSLLRAERTLGDAKDNLLNAIGLDPGSMDFEPAQIQKPTHEIPTEEQLFTAALAKQPRYQTLLTQIDQRHVELKRARRNRLPTLNLNGTYAQTGLRGTSSDSFDEIGTGDSYNWALNLTVEAPWGLRDRKANYQKAQLQLDSDEARALKEKQNILRDSRAAIREAQLARESIEIKTLASQLSEEEFEMEKAKFDSGLSTGRRVLEAQQRMDESRVDELQSKLDFLNAHSNIQRIDGKLLVRYKVEVE